MTNSAPITYKNNFAGLFADSRGGWTFTSGKLTVMDPVIVGLYSYSSQSSFLNSFSLNGVALTDSMAVVAIFGTGRVYSAYADSLIQPSSCSSANTAVFTSSATTFGCSVSLATSGGHASVAITASYAGFSTSVAYRAYFFMGFSLGATRSELRQLGCDFETAYLSAYGSLTLDGVSSLATLDLTSRVTFVSSDPSIVSIDGRVARGIALGTAVVSFGGGLGTTSFTTSSSVASVVHLVSYAYSSIDIAPASVFGEDMLSVSLQLQARLLLTAEQQTAALITFAMDDDGVWTDVSQYSTLTLLSNSAADLNVTKSGNNWHLEVPVGASSISGDTPVISATLTDSCAAPLSLTGYGYVNSNLSVPIAIGVSSAEVLLARPGTPAATTLGVATLTQLIVTVTFQSAMGSISTKDFTLDPRSVFTVNFVNSTGSVSSTALLALTSNLGFGSAGTVEVVVTMPSYVAALGLSGSVVIRVVDVDISVPLQGALVHSMTPAVPVASTTPLSKIACTGVYQDGVLDTVSVTLTDGSTRLGPPVLASSDTTVAFINGMTVVALSQGTSTITAVYANATGLFIAYVVDNTVDVSAITLGYSSNTIAGQTGSTVAGSVSVSFTDGTSFSDAVASFSPLSSLIGFSSSDPDFVAVSSSGVASLINNSWQLSTLTAFSMCGDGNSGTFSIAGNLAPVNYDTKLGYLTGITFPPASFGQIVDASINLMVSLSPLTTYQIWLFYNSAVFGTPTISKGSGWPTGAFDFTTGNTVDGTIVKAVIRSLS